MATSSFSLDSSIWNQDLFDRVQRIWFGEQPVDAKLATEASMRTWFHNPDREAARRLDDRCRDHFLSALETLFPEHVNLPAASSWQDEQQHAASLAAPFMSHLRDVDAEQRASTALSIVVLLDQMPRNIFRAEQGVIYTQIDRLSRAFVHTLYNQPDRPDHNSGIKECHARRLWFYMPLMHSEHIEDHDLFVQNAKKMRADETCNAHKQIDDMMARQDEYEEKHAEIIRQFGRYPYRNEAIGRQSTPEEVEWLKTGERFSA